MSLKLPRLFLVLLAVVFTLNLIQAHFTELLYDEAYYWYYAQQLDWGYFDHPPLIAVLIALSHFLFDGELGVRFMSCILSAGTSIILWQLVEHPRKKEYVVHFFLLACAFPLLNAYSFLMLPDTPLLFCTALFLLLYKRFLNRPTTATSIVLGIVMAALLYSKYHAGLVILLVFLSNVTLVKSGKAWLALAVALTCYTPHLVWLYQNDFVTIRYHLLDRLNQAYSFEKFTLRYFLNLLAITGLLFYWICRALFKYRAKDKFSKALLYLTYGFITFLFITSFTRKVQAQWAIVISIPLVVITFDYLIKNTKGRQWIYRVGILSCILLVYARAWLVYRPLFPLRFETHGNTQWVDALHAKVGNIPVVFENSYRRAAMYAFYSGNPTFSLNTYKYRKNQYTIDDSEEKVRRKTIAYVTSHGKQGDVTYTHPNGTVYYGTFKDNFESYRKLKCIVEKQNPGTSFTLKVYNPYPFAIPLDALQYTVAYSNAYKRVKELLPLRVEPLVKRRVFLRPKDTVLYTFQLPLPRTIASPKYFSIGITEHGLLPGLQGEPIKLLE